MYKVMHWMRTLIGDFIGDAKYTKVEHYFTDSEKAINYFCNQSKLHENAALVVSTEHVEFVFMHHYNDDFPKELRPDVLGEIELYARADEKAVFDFVNRNFCEE